MSDFEDPAWVKMGVAGALEQEYLKDQGFFLELLAKTLSTALPDETALQTKGFLKKTINAIQVSLADVRYTFEKPDRGPVLAKKTKVVRGIALKTEEIPVAEGLLELGEAMEQRAAKSGQARAAMAKMLGLE